MNETVTGTGNLVRIAEPKFLSLVDKPANKRAFTVVRSDEESQPQGETPMKPQVVRRQRRSETSPILRMVFPVAYTDEQVTARMEDFGLTGYDVLRGEQGVVATRSDLKSISTAIDSTPIMLTADGIVAEVARMQQEPANPKSNIKVTSLTFRADKFDAEAVKAWLAGNNMPAEPASAEGAGDFLVVRHEVPEGEETRAVVLEEGVTATVVRSDMQDIPDGFVAVVNETCYGNWGWGQLDFTAAMADEEFTEAMDEAIYLLRRILHNVLLYSALPIAERKVLMVRVLQQFSDFSIGILDSLPRTVLVAAVRSASTPKEKSDMTQKTEGGAVTKTPEVPAGDTPVTREEVAGLVTAAVTAALTAAGVTATRSEPAAPEAKKEDEPAQPAAPAVAITREDVVAATKEAVAAALAPMVERLDRVEGTTVLRSDTGDSKVETNKKDTKQGEKTDVFRGAPVFGALGLGRARGAAS